MERLFHLIQHLQSKVVQVDIGKDGHWIKTIQHLKIGLILFGIIKLKKCIYVILHGSSSGDLIKMINHGLLKI